MAETKKPTAVPRRRKLNKADVTGALIDAPYQDRTLFKVQCTPFERSQQGNMQLSYVSPAGAPNGHRLRIKLPDLEISTCVTRRPRASTRAHTLCTHLCSSCRVGLRQRQDPPSARQGGPCEPHRHVQEH